MYRMSARFDPHKPSFRAICQNLEHHPTENAGRALTELQLNELSIVLGVKPSQIYNCRAEYVRRLIRKMSLPPAKPQPDHPRNLLSTVPAQLAREATQYLGRGAHLAHPYFTQPQL